MPVQTRSQRDYALAITLVTAVQNEPETVQKIYGGLCHGFPVLVRASGLAQATAFHQAKAASRDDANARDRARAHQLLLQHMADLAGVEDLPGHAHQAQTRDYQITTRRILDGAVFFRRLATSLLGVDSGDTREG